MDDMVDSEKWTVNGEQWTVNSVNRMRDDGYDEKKVL